MKKLVTTALLIGFVSAPAKGGLIFEPYYSVSSTKSVSPNRKKNTETETVQQREEKGLRAGLTLGLWFKLIASVGQSFHVTTTTESAMKDEYGALDFSSELDTTTVGKEKKKKETQNRARAEFLFDPSFSIFIMRAKAGVIANQRIVKLLADDQLISTVEPEPTYKPTGGVGLGIRFNSQMYAIAEYSFYFYQFPKTEPFEREVTISYGFSL